MVCNGAPRFALGKTDRTQFWDRNFGDDSEIVSAFCHPGALKRHNLLKGQADYYIMPPTKETEIEFKYLVIFCRIFR
jgi:hypothetical protein